MNRVNWLVTSMFFVLLLVLVVGCVPNQDETTQGQPPVSQSTVSPYVLPEVGNSYPLPSPVPTLLYAFRQSKSGTVTVHGELLAMNPDDLPAHDDAIFLAPISGEEQVSTIPPIVVGGTLQADVHEATGEFVFTDVEPGLYAVVVLTISNAQIPARMSNGSFAILKIEESDRDHTIDLGTIRIP